MKIRFTHIIFTVILTVIAASALWLTAFRDVYAADGSGTMTASPANVTAGSTGNTLAFTFTANETLDSGGLTLTVPSSWTTPQGTTGVAGYTITTSTLGTVGTVVNNLDTATNWTATTHQTLSADTTNKQEGAASLSNAITTSTVANEQWYFNYGGATSWGTTNGNTTDRIGFWLKSSANTASGDFSWRDDNSTNLASPLDTVSLPALTANTWTYAAATLAAARTSQLSYGFRYTTDIGTTTFKVDSISKIFDAADSTTGWSSDSNIIVSLLNTAGNFKEGTGAIRCAYASGAGIGTSGDCFDSESNSFTTGPDAKVSFWIRSSVALNAGDFAFIDDRSSNVASVLDSVNLPALSANTWTYVTLSAPNIASTRSYGLRQLVDKGAMNIDIDAIGNVIDSADSATGWTTSSDGIQALSVDATTFHEGAASLKNVISATAASGDNWHQTFGSAQDWSGYTTVGLWIRSTVATAAGDLKFEYSSASDLASPIASINIGALSANTWTYQKLTLTGTRTSINSFGINYSTDIGAATVNLDDILIGPGVPTFPGGGIINVRILQLGNGQTIGVTYGSGDGASGATAPATGRTDTFTTQTRTSDNGTLTSIVTFPTITVNNPMPTTSSILPTSTTTGAIGFTLTVTGTGFNSSSTVKFNGSSRATTFISSSTLQASILASDLTAGGTSPITVTNPAPGGGTSNSQTFTVSNSTPSTSSLSPSSITAGSSGFTLTVNGANFVSGAVVKFNGNSRTTTFVSDTQVTASILAADVATAGAFNVLVTNPTPGGGDSNAQTFTVVNPQPTTASISPSSKSAGDAQFTLTVTGTGFNASSLVRFNGSNRSTSFTSSSSLDAIIPASDLTSATSSALITVFNPTPGGGTSNAQVFSVGNSTPSTSSLSPSSITAGSSGFTLTVNGANFVSGAVVKFNGNSRTTTFVSDTQVTASILAADVATAGAFNVLVTNPTPGGGDSNAQTFTVVNPQPTINSFSAASSTIQSGQSTTLTWSTTNATSVSIDQGIGAVATSGSQTVSPTATTTYTLTVTGTGGTATASVTVNVSPAPTTLPTISFSVSTSTIVTGQSTTLTWSTTNATSVSIDQGIGAVATSGSQTVSPTMDTTYTIMVTGPGGTQTANVLVTVTPPATSAPAINSFTINPASITAGESAIIS